MNWISVEDRLPEPFVYVLGYMTDADEFPPVRECYTVGGKAFFFPALNDIHHVSHWMPMPEPPLAIIGARGGGKVLMAKAMKEAAIKRGEKVIVVRKGDLKHELQDH